MRFTDLGLHADIVRGIKDLGYQRPTPIQESAMPAALEGKDLLACAATGSGKTAAFVVPILERLIAKPRAGTRALILTPTRELAAQIAESISELAVHTPLSGAAIYGGVSMGPQEHALRTGVDIIVATPGRLLDHLRFPYCNFERLEVLVLDEADRMLDMGFLPDIRRILKRLPTRRQTLFFSATMPPPIAELSREMLHAPTMIDHARRAEPPALIDQRAFAVDGTRKSELLYDLITKGEIKDAIVFTRTKARTNRLAEFLEKRGVACGRLHGNRSQRQRETALDQFKSGKTRILVATDIAARGIDVQQLGHVVNFDVPHVPEDYIHRVGRTGRAGSAGEAITFVSPEEEKDFRAIERAIDRVVERIRHLDYTRPSADATKRPPARGPQQAPQRAPARGPQSAAPRAPARKPAESPRPFFHKGVSERPTGRAVTRTHGRSGGGPRRRRSR
jgi:ATP-dependent RNA helicase RhlE